MEQGECQNSGISAIQNRNVMSVTLDEMGTVTPVAIVNAGCDGGHNRPSMAEFDLNVMASTFSRVTTQDIGQKRRCVSSESDVTRRIQELMRMGSERIRVPVSLATALATAGAMGGVPGSPTPPGSAPLSMTWVSIRGISLSASMR